MLVFIALLVVVLLIVDQSSKSFFRDVFQHEGVWMPVIPGILNFMYVENRGAAFGLFAGHQEIFVIIAALVVIASLIFLALYRHVSWIQATSIGLVIAGAIGNLIDRLLYGFVTDFIALAFIQFPVFNIADIAITLGCILFTLSILHDESLDGREAPDLALENETVHNG